MASFLSPGVFVEEVSNAPQTIDAVGTSTMAIVGFTPQGPTDEATLVTGLDSYTRTFGPYSALSLVPISVTAFFQNGGSRAYVVRVVPSDAAAAVSNITGIVSGEAVGSPATGATPITISGTLTTPPQAGTTTVTWIKVATVVTAENPTFSPAENGVLLGPFTATLANTKITNDTITIHWLESAVAKTATLTSSNVLGGANSANLASATLNRSSGVLVITFAAGHPPDTNSITVDYTPQGATATVTDVAGVFSGSGIAGTVDSTTGAITITFTGATVVPYDGDVVTAAYTTDIWGLTAASKGVWGNDLEVVLSGSPNFFTYGPATVTGAGTYSKFDIQVLQLNDSDVFEVKETYEEVVFDDATDPMYVADVINQGSSLVTITDHGYLTAPTTFNGTAVTAEAIATGDGVTKTYSHTAADHTPGVVKTSLVVHYTVGAAPFTATANSSGTISGTNIDGTKTNTINWTTGLVTLNFSTAPDNSTAITMDYIQSPATSSVTYTFSTGSDGTIANITNLTVSNLADLGAGKLGMYALNRIDEIMQLVIPDFAGDTTVQSDMIAYAESRRDIFCILTTPSGKTAQQAVDYINIDLNVKSKYAAMYWPWVRMADPSAANRTLLVPVVAHVAGIYSRTDGNKNVSKAPAGTVDGQLRGITGLEFSPDQGDRDTVYPARVNPLINSPQTGMAVWGARSMSPTSDAFKYIQATRLFQFVEKSVFNATQSYIFESINANLFNSIKSQVGSFLLNLYNNAYFAGTSQLQAYAVKCDTDNNPPETQDLGQVICDIAIAPNKPGEFLRFRFAVQTISS